MTVTEIENQVSFGAVGNPARNRLLVPTSVQFKDLAKL